MAMHGDIKPRIETTRISELVKMRWAGSEFRRWVQLVVGTLLLIGVGMIAAHYITLSLEGSAAHLPVYWLAVGGVIVVLLIAARYVKQSLFGREAMYLKPEVTDYGMPRYSSYGEQEIVVTQLTIAAILDLVLFPAGWVVKVVEEWRFLRVLGDLNVPLATDLVMRLLAEDQGISLASIKLPYGGAADKMHATVAHLRLLEIVDRSDKRDRVWLTSRARDQLVKGG